MVVDAGRSWLGECAGVGLPATGIEPLTGAELLAVAERVARHPDLARADVREIGLAIGRKAEGGGPLYALVLGTPRAVVRVQCFDDAGFLVDRAAAAMRQAQQAAAW